MLASCQKTGTESTGQHRINPRPPKEQRGQHYETEWDNQKWEDIVNPYKAVARRI